jgi:hypothetical protein
MLIAMLVVIGCGTGALVWLPWRRAYPLRPVRAILSVLVAAATILALWAAHEATEAARAGAGAGEGIDKIRVH